MKKVKNQWEIEIDFDVAVQLMDDCIREEVHGDLAPCTEQMFFAEYCKKHEELFGEPFELDKENPVY